MRTAGRTEKNDTKAGKKIFKTFGEVFPDGSLIELVSSPTGDLPNLLLWKRKVAIIGRQVKHDGHIYQAQELPSGIVRATRWVREPVGYGTIGQLFTELVGTFEEYLAFSKSAAQQIAYWVLTTSFCDCLTSPPALWAFGSDMEQAANFFALLDCLCRRALRVSGVTRAGFLSLPMSFRPTLLVNQASLSRSLQNLWCESNFRGSVIPGNRGTVLDVTSSKAIFVGMDGSAPPPSAGNLHLDLFPPDHEVPPLDKRALDAIAKYFLPRLMQYRLDHAHSVRESRFVPDNLRFPTRELARKLGACIQGDAELALQVVPLLLAQDDIVGRCNLDCAILEILWPRLHLDVPTAASMKIEAELTPDVNTSLLCCGETRQYSREEVGIRVAKFKLSRKHTNTGTLLVLDRATSRRVHELMRSYGIDKSVLGCPDCQPLQTSLQ